MQALRRSGKAQFRFGFIGFSLSSGFQVFLSKCWHLYVTESCTMFFSVVFLPYLRMLILSLPILVLRSKSSSLSSDFRVCRPR